MQQFWSGEELDTLKGLKHVTRTLWSKGRILQNEAGSYRVLEFILRVIRNQEGILNWEVIGFSDILPLWLPSFGQTLVVYHSALDVVHSTKHTLQAGSGEDRVGWATTFVLDMGLMHRTGAFAWIVTMSRFVSYRTCGQLKQYLIWLGSLTLAGLQRNLRPNWDVQD